MKKELSPEVKEYFKEIGSKGGKSHGKTKKERREHMKWVSHHRKPKEE